MDDHITIKNEQPQLITELTELKQPRLNTEFETSLSI